jgi:hypothetical protein
MKLMTQPRQRNETITKEKKAGASIVSPGALLAEHKITQNR